ncbi:MAG: alkaline phosphatase, partial [Owenweeksia sp.]
GVDKDTSAVETLLEYFHKQQKSTALIATSSITHATPASFYAHVDSRNKAYEIAEYMAPSGTDFFAGGGRQFFRSEEVVKALKKEGYVVDTNKLKPSSELNPVNKYGFLLANDGMPRMMEGRGSFLQDATELALEYLKKKNKPFFMMVEGSQIDWGGHANEVEYVVTETLDFDKMVGSVLDFAEKDGHTLVIVTADHETGGFTLASEVKEVPFKGKQSDYNSIAPVFSTGGHSAAMVPVLAYGPGAEKFSGIYQNTEIHTRIMELLKMR